MQWVEHRYSNASIDSELASYIRDLNNRRVVCEITRETDKTLTVRYHLSQQQRATVMTMGPMDSRKKKQRIIRYLELYVMIVGGALKS